MNTSKEKILLTGREAGQWKQLPLCAGHVVCNTHKGKGLLKLCYTEKGGEQGYVAS